MIFVMFEWAWMSFLCDQVQTKCKKTLVLILTSMNNWNWVNLLSIMVLWYYGIIVFIEYLFVHATQIKKRHKNVWSTFHAVITNSEHSKVFSYFIHQIMSVDFESTNFACISCFLSFFSMSKWVWIFQLKWHAICQNLSYL